MDSITCKKCGNVIEVTEALRHQIQEQVLASEKIKHDKEIEEVKKKARLDATAKAEENLEVQLQSLRAEKNEEKERNKKLLAQLEDLNTQLRELRRKDEERELEMKKHLAEVEEGIRADARKKAIQENELRDREKDKKLQDALKQVEELKEKIQRGSQQAQGEVMEIALEEVLKIEFPQDKISEVKKGQRGADILQVVIDKLGRECGSILWESKNAQWSQQWLSKLRQDQRDSKAQVAVLVVEKLPPSTDSFTFTDGVWVTNRKTIIGLAMALRTNLISIQNERSNKEGKDDKLEGLYEYLTSTDFKHRVEAIVEGFSNLQQDIEKEKRWFITKWARQEKEIRKIVDNTQGMYGDLQSVTGRALSPIKVLELPSGDIDSSESNEDKISF